MKQKLLQIETLYERILPRKQSNLFVVGVLVNVVVCRRERERTHTHKIRETQMREKQVRHMI